VKAHCLCGHPSYEKAERLTDDLLVCAVLACTDVDEVKQCLAACEAAHEILEHASVLNRTGAHEHISEATNVGVHAANDAGSERNVCGFCLNVILHCRMQLDGRARTTSLALA
jgi:hypothetical protein